MQKIFSVIIILALIAWVSAIASLTGCSPQEQLEDSYNCEEASDINMGLPF